MANKALRFTSRTQRGASQRYFVIDDPSWCAAALLLVLTLSSSAFFIDQTQLVYLCVVDGMLLLHGCYLRGKLMSLIKLFVVQLLVTCCLYLLMQQSDRMLEGVLAVCRLLLAAIPGWWLAMSCSPERIAEVLNWVMPVKWAFVVAASISLLPFSPVKYRKYTLFSVCAALTFPLKRCAIHAIGQSWCTAFWCRC